MIAQARRLLVAVVLFFGTSSLPAQGLVTEMIASPADPLPVEPGVPVNLDLTVRSRTTSSHTISGGLAPHPQGPSPGPLSPSWRTPAAIAAR